MPGARSFKGIDVSFLASELNSARRPNNDGTISYDSFLIDDLRSVIDTAFGFGTMGEMDRYSTITSALFNIDPTVRFTDETLVQALNTACDNFFTKHFQVFDVHTSIVCGAPFVQRSTKASNATVTMLRKIPSKIRRAILAYDRELPDRDRALNDFQQVRVRVRARSPWGAVEQATAELEFLRGVWNFSVRRQSFWGFDRSGPVNHILPGPYVTVHHPNGELALQTFWREQTYSAPDTFPAIGTFWPDLMKHERKIRRHLGTVPYRRVLRACFCDYAAALDHDDGEVALIKLWKVLEALTACRDGKTRPVIDRCVSIMKDPQYPRLILQHVRDRRNSHVHEAGTRGTCDQYVRQLRRYVDALFSVHLGVGSGFRTIDDACAFFDLPRDQAKLKAEVAVRRKALKFREVRP